MATDRVLRTHHACIALRARRVEGDPDVGFTRLRSYARNNHLSVREVAGRYVELFETVTGRALEADLSPDPEARIREVLGV